MKWPFRETPILYGKDAIRFEKLMNEAKRLPQERLDEMQKQYDEFVKKVIIKI